MPDIDELVDEQLSRGDLTGIAPDILEREWIMLWEAISAVGQCGLVLGADLVNRISADIDAVRTKVKGRLDELGSAT